MGEHGRVQTEQNNRLTVNVCYSFICIPCFSNTFLAHFSLSLYRNTSLNSFSTTTVCSYRTMNRSEADKLEAAHLNTVAVNWKENESKNVTLVGRVSDEAIWRQSNEENTCRKSKLLSGNQKSLVVYLGPVMLALPALCSRCFIWCFMFYYLLFWPSLSSKLWCISCVCVLFPHVYSQYVVSTVWIWFHRCPSVRHINLLYIWILLIKSMDYLNSNERLTGRQTQKHKTLANCHYNLLQTKGNKHMWCCLTPWSSQTSLPSLGGSLNWY